MKNFVINKSTNLNRTLLVTALSYVNPVTYLRDIENELKDSSEFKVIIDLLSSNNAKPYRFLSADIVMGELDENSFKVEDSSLDALFIAEANNIVREQANLEDNYIVSRTKKHLIVNC